jgi:hypothetical protein
MKPFRHARRSSHLFGGAPEDYQDIHDFIDQSKVCHGDVRHRALFHHTLGCFLVEQVFGITRRNSSGRDYSPRDVAEQHILDDLGTIPSPSDYLKNMTTQKWMGGPKKRVQRWLTETDSQS